MSAPFLREHKNLTGSLTSLEINDMCCKITNINRSEGNKLCVEFLAAHFPVKWCNTIFKPQKPCKLNSVYSESIYFFYTTI